MTDGWKSWAWFVITNMLVWWLQLGQKPRSQDIFKFNQEPLGNSGLKNVQFVTSCETVPSVHWAPMPLWLTKKMLLNSTSESSYLSSAVICRGLTVCTTTGTLVADMMWESTYSIPTVVLWIGGRCIGDDTTASGASWEDQYIRISLYETSQQLTFSQRPTVTHLRSSWSKKKR